MLPRNDRRGRLCHCVSRLASVSSQTPRSLFPGGAAVAVIGGMLRVEPDRLVVVGDGAVEIALLLIGDGAVVEAVGVGLEADRLAVVGDGPVVIALGVIGLAAVVDGVDIAGIEPNRLVVILQGAVEIAGGGDGGATVAERNG